MTLWQGIGTGWAFCTGTLAVWRCKLRGAHTELMVTSADRAEVYIHCPFCRRRTHGVMLAPDRRRKGRPGSMDVQRVVTHLPLATLERLAAFDRRCGADRRLTPRRTVAPPIHASECPDTRER